MLFCELQKTSKNESCFKWQRYILGTTQGERPGARDQAGAGGHRPAGDHQGDLHHAAVRQSLRGQILRQLFQEYRSVGK